jgi:hypothetical protein
VFLRSLSAKQSSGKFPTPCMAMEKGALRIRNHAGISFCVSLLQTFFSSYKKINTRSLKRNSQKKSPGIYQEIFAAVYLVVRIKRFPVFP